MTHTITAVWDDTSLGIEVEVEVVYGFTPGSPDTYDAARGGPGGWDPGYPAEVEFISATARVPEGDAYSQGALDEWASAWLQGAGYDDAVANVAECDQPDPDAARDAAIDDALTTREERF